jgi:hypothetical protein
MKTKAMLTGALDLLVMGVVTLNLVLLTGCGSSPAASSGGGGGGNTGAATSVYVVQNTNTGGSILEFSATASGSVSPTNSITTGLPLSQIATDQAGNIYVYTFEDIREYAVGATGSAKPIRAIVAGTTSGIYEVDGLAVSPTGAIVVGQDGGDVDEWSATQNGDVAPVRYIPSFAQTGGSLSPIQVANQVAVDGSDNIYVANLGADSTLPGGPSIVIFGPTQNGNVAPGQSFGNYSTLFPGGVTTDSAGNIYVTSYTCPIAGCAGSISVFAPTASGSDAPTRTITGSATQLQSLCGIKVDDAGNIFAVSTDQTGNNPTVLKFAPTATGNVAPISSFTSTAWTTPDINDFNPALALH